MERVAMFARLNLRVLLLLSLRYGTHGSRMLNARVQGELPPCTMHWQVPGWDCYDPPKKPLPPCDFKHHSPGIDCSTDSPATTDVADLSHAASTVSTPVLASGTQSADAQQWPELPPCNFPGAIPGWDCFDPPTHDLPPCDFKHQRVGIDCWPKSPPAAKVTPVTDINSAAGGASTHISQSSTTQSGGAHHVQGELPPCTMHWQVPGWDCYDPPKTPLPPCDSKHHSPGIDCSTDPPHATATSATNISAAGGASTHDVQGTTQSGAHHVQGLLPPCKDVWGGIPGWGCFDPPPHDLPPCDFKHQRAGFDCWPGEPPSASP